MQFFIVSILVILVPGFATADWGLGEKYIVQNCQEKAVEKCETFRGRSNKTNGSASTVIWKVGTKRIVSWGAATHAANDLIKEKMDFSHTLYAHFLACPMEKDIPGHRIKYCIQEIENPRWVRTKY